MTELMEDAKPEIQALDSNEARITFGPLERGYGHTLGNALRRILLSSIPGAAVVEVRIDGVEHECDTIEGVREDVIEILLNLKPLAVQLVGFEGGGEDCILKLHQKGAGEVRADQFELPAGVIIASPELYICSVTGSDVELNLEVRVRQGLGYDPADQRTSEEEKTIGTLDVDANFSPISRVAYQVENVRVAGQTDLDRLIITLTTNGTVEPAEIIGQAATLLRRQLQPLAGLTEHSDTGEELNEVYYQTLEALNLETRVINVLRSSLGIYRIGDLVQRTEVELLETPRLATKSVDQLKDVLLQRGLSLNMTLPGWKSGEEPEPILDS